MKRISDCGETTVVVPLVVEPIQVQPALVIPVVKMRHVAVAVAIPPHRTMYEVSSAPPPIEYSPG